MLESYLIQLEYLLRILIAAICGIAIGYERKNRMKEAGIRTHFIVALGSALIIIVSKYGFQDQIGWNNLSLDPSRIAAQVVTGVGFLGAGIIFMQKENIRGLTTAAGIWTTAAIGLAIGSGLYLVGVASAIILIVGQILFHGKIKWLSSLKTEVLILQIENEPEVVQNIQKFLKEQDVTILNLKAKSIKESSEKIDLKVVIRVSEGFDTSKLVCTLQDNPFVKSIEF